MFKKNWLLVLFALFFLLLFLFFPRESGPEMILKFHREIPLESGTSHDLSQEILWLKSRDYHFSLDAQGDSTRVVNDRDFSSTGEIGLLRPDQELWEFLPSRSDESYFLDNPFPMTILGARLISIEPYGVIKEWTKEGELLWSHQLPSSLTSYGADENTLVFGCLNGEVHILNSKGELIQQYRPGGSRIEAVYAVAIGDEGRIIAMISGLYPQRLIILEKKSGDYRPVFHQNMNSQFRRPLSMFYSKQGRFFSFEDQQGVTLFHIDEFKMEQLETGGKLVAAVFPEQLENPLLLVSLGDRYRLCSYLNGKRFFQRDFKGDYADLITLDERVYLVLDNRILELSWRFQ